MPGDGAVPELVEAGGEAGEGGFEVVADLAVERSALADEVTALADEQEQGGPSFVACGFEESAAGDRGAVDGGQVGVVGFVAGIDGLAILFGDEGMEDARLEAGRGEAALDEAVIAAGAFDGDEAVGELVSGEGRADLCDGGVEVGRPARRLTSTRLSAWNSVKMLRKSIRSSNRADHKFPAHCTLVQSRQFSDIFLDRTGS